MKTLRHLAGTPFRIPALGGLAGAERLQTDDPVYRGAIRLPGPSGSSTREHGGNVLACCPAGDSQGPADGHPGSLFGVGHDWDKHASEITIPVPVASPDRRLSDLNTAQALQPFRNVRAGVGDLDRLNERLCVGMTHLPAQGQQTWGKLYLCWGQHFREEAGIRTAFHLRCDVTLTAPRGASSRRAAPLRLPR